MQPYWSIACIVDDMHERLQLIRYYSISLVANLIATQVAKWMLGKGQGATMGTYDSLLLAFDMDQRVDEAEALWNMILHTHKRSISKRLFSRMISLYDHHDMKDKIIEVIHFFMFLQQKKKLVCVNFYLFIKEVTDSTVFAIGFIVR